MTVCNTWMNRKNVCLDMSAVCPIHCVVWCALRHTMYCIPRDVFPDSMFPILIAS